MKQITDPDRFQKIASGIQSYMLTLAIVVGGIWTAVQFNALKQRDIAVQQLESLKKAAALSVQFELAATPWDGHKGGTCVMVTARFTNQGSGSTTANWPEFPLTASPVKFDTKGAILFGSPIHARFLTPRGTRVLRTLMLPKATTLVPFLICLPNDGLYLFEVGFTENRKEQLSHTAEGLLPTNIWSENFYVSINKGALTTPSSGLPSAAAEGNR